MPRRWGTILVILLLVLAGMAGSTWKANDWYVQRVVRTRQQADAFTQGQFAMSTGDCTRALKLLTQATSADLDRETASQATADRLACQRYARVIPGRGGRAGAQVEATLDLLKTKLPPGLMSTTQRHAQLILNSSAAQLFDQPLCQRFDDLLSTGVFDLDRPTTATFRYLTACWNILRTTRPGDAARLLAVLRVGLASGVAAAFPGPSDFSGPSRSSTLTFVNTSDERLDVFLAGATQARHVQLKPCTRVCDADRYPCRSNSRTATTVVPGEYIFMVRNPRTDNSDVNGSRGYWVLLPGRAEQCID